MGFHEYILSAILLLIVAQAFTFISKIMKNSLQNFHSYIKIFDFQINVFILESFCPPPHLQPSSKGLINH